MQAFQCVAAGRDVGQSARTGQAGLRQFFYPPSSHAREKPGTRPRTGQSPRPGWCAAQTRSARRSPPPRQRSPPRPPPAAAALRTTARRPSACSSSATSVRTSSARWLPMFSTRAGGASSDGGCSRHAHHPGHDVVDIGEIPLQPAVVVQRDRLAGDDRPGEAVIRHVRPAPRPIHREEPQPGLPACRTDARRRGSSARPPAWWRRRATAACPPGRSRGTAAPGWRRTPTTCWRRPSGATAGSRRATSSTTR